MTRKHDNKPKRSSNHPAKPRKNSRGQEGAPKAQQGGPVASGCALCPVFGQCGGCSQLDVPYDQQLSAKQRAVYDLFEGLAPAEAFQPVLGMEHPFHYRNKVVSPYAPAKGKRGAAAGKRAAERGTDPRGVESARRHGAKGAHDVQGSRSAAGRYSVESSMPHGAKGGRGSQGSRSAKQAREAILTGMYAPGTHRLIPTDTCAIENETAKQVTLAVRDIMARWDMAPYNEDTGEGFVRHVVVRVGHESGEVLVTVVTNGEEFPSAKAFCRELVRRVPAITTIVQNVNTRQTNVILGEKERTLYGPGFILDTLCGLSFRISSKSFYQVNTTQTEVLYDEAVRLAQLTGAETVIDAYCGTGTIGLVAAKRGARRVIGVDSVASAIRDAATNARHNGVENADFVAEDATAFMERLAASDERPEPLVLLMDPPRAGSTPAFLAAACALAPQRIVYISCNPTTQARDVRQLVDSGYEIKAIRPVDMFPHTDHIESIVMLEKHASELKV